MAERSLSGAPIDASTYSASMRNVCCAEPCRRCFSRPRPPRNNAGCVAESNREGALEYYSIRSSRPAKINIMRMLLQISIPHDPFNAAVKDGTAGQKLGRIVDEIKPEAIYFTEQHGQRGAIMIVEMADPSKIPALAEPWFLTFNASVEFRVVMTPDDLQKAGLDEVGRKWA